MNELSLTLFMDLTNLTNKTKRQERCLKTIYLTPIRGQEVVYNSSVDS